MYRTPLLQVPLLRVALPFVVGILLCRAMPAQWCAWMVIALGAVAVVGVALVYALCGPKRRSQVAIAPIAALSVALGMGDAWLSLPLGMGEKFCGEKPIIGTVTRVKQNEASTSLMVRTSEAGVVSLLINGNHYGYSAGDRVAFRPNLEKIRNSGNPYEFDYRRYMLEQSSAYSQFVDNASGVPIVGRSSSPYYWLQRVRDGIRTSVMNAEASPQTKSLLAALLLGYGADIDPSFRTLMSQAGVAHIVALSGLHVGLVALFVVWLLMPVLRKGRLKARVLCVALAIMAFAVFTGLSPSVSRAALMAAFGAAAVVSNRRMVSLNALLGAALLILVVSPNSLYDVGFLLSFVTVASLLIACSKLQGVLNVRNRVVRYVAFCVSVSVVSMLSTSALTAYYFHTVSILAFIANLIVLPLMPVYVAVAAVYVALLVAGVDVTLLAIVLDCATAAFAWVVDVFGNLSFSHIDNVWITPYEVAAYYFAIVSLGVMFVLKRKGMAVMAFLVATIAGVTIHIVNMSIAPQEGLIVLNSYNSTPVFYFRAQKGYLWCPDREVEVDEFSAKHRALLCRLDIETVEPIEEPCAVAGCEFQRHYAFVMGRRIVVIGGKSAITKEGLLAIDADYAIVPYDCRTNLPWEQVRDGARCIVLSGGMWRDKLDKVKTDLSQLGISYHSLKDSGAIVLYR